MSDSGDERCDGQQEEKKNAVDVVLDRIEPNIAECWHAQDSETLVSRIVAGGVATEPVQSVALVRHGGAVTAEPVRSVRVEAWLRAVYRAECHRAIPKMALERAIDELHSRGIEGSEYEPRVRVGGGRGRVVVDLGDDSHRVLDIRAGDWSVRPAAIGDRLVRRRGMLPLPVPVRGGALDELRDLINVPDDQWPLVLAWLVCSACPLPPWPILRVEGEQGSGKSTLCRVLRSVLDPHMGDLRDAPTRSDEIAVACRSAWIIAYENLTAIQGTISNSLCIVATGGAFATREFYSNHDEVLIRLGRPMILNGISGIVARSDLADRCLTLRLPPIEGCKPRIDDGEIASAIAAMRPRLLGALADAVACAIARLPEVKRMPDIRWPRMSEAAKWAMASEPALGLEPGTIIRAWQENRSDTVDRDLGDDPVYAAVLEIADRGVRWEESPQPAYAELCAVAGPAAHRPGWPRSPRSMSRRLNELSPSLRQQGILWETKKAAKGERVWSIGRIGG